MVELAGRGFLRRLCPLLSSRSLALYFSEFLSLSLCISLFIRLIPSFFPFLSVPLCPTLSSQNFFLSLSLCISLLIHLISSFFPSLSVTLCPSLSFSLPPSIAFAIFFLSSFFLSLSLSLLPVFRLFPFYLSHPGFSFSLSPFISLHKASQCILGDGCWMSVGCVGRPIRRQLTDGELMFMCVELIKGLQPQRTHRQTQNKKTNFAYFRLVDCVFIHLYWTFAYILKHRHSHGYLSDNNSHKTLTHTQTIQTQAYTREQTYTQPICLDTHVHTYEHTHTHAHT